MSTKGVGTFGINSQFASGSLVFYEKAVGRTATGDVFTVGTAAVKVGGTSQDVDFQVYGTGSLSAIIDIGAGTLTLTGITSNFLSPVNFGVDATGVDVTFFGDTASHKVWFDQNGDTNGAWFFGADTKGVLTQWYGDTTGYYVKFDPSGDTNGAWYFGVNDFGVDVAFYGQTATNSMTWDASANALIFVAGGITLGVATDIVLDTTTGTKIGTGTTQKLGFWNAAPGTQPAHIADPANGGVIDAEARTAINSINALCATLGLTAAA